MDWYKNAQIADISAPQRPAKYHQGQNVIVYNSSGGDSGIGIVLDSQYYAGEDEYAYHIRFEEANETFKEDKLFKEKDIIPY